MLASPCS
jgi:hypothetical protein